MKMPDSPSDFNKMNNKSFLVVFANLKGNVGDLAILHAIVLDLRKNHPGCSLSVAAHGFHQTDNEKLQTFLREAPSGIRFWKTPSVTYPKWLKRLSRFGLKRFAQARLIQKHCARLQHHDELIAGKQYDAIFVAGGGQWSGQALGVNMFSVIGALSRYNKNIYSYPFSIKREILNFNYPANLRRYFNQFAVPPLVRDSHSFDLFRRIEVRTELGADCVFSLASLAQDIVPASPTRNNSIVFAITRAPGSRENELKETLQRILQAGYQVKLLTTCESEDGDYLKRLSVDFDIPYLAPLSWRETVAEFKSDTLVITNRLHCTIFSFFAQVPVLPLANREKVRSLASDADLPYSIEKISDLSAETIQAIGEQRKQVSQKMAAYLEKSRHLKTSPLQARPLAG